MISTIARQLTQEAKMNGLVANLFGCAFGAVLASVFTLATPAHGQAQAPNQKSASVTATLYRVESGLFDAEADKVMDLTDRMIIFKWAAWNRSEANLKEKLIDVRFNNQSIATRPAQRVDLKGMFREELKDKGRCFIDLIDVIAPQGGAPIATFRFECR
jgi:hypothetical protein